MRLCVLWRTGEARLGPVIRNVYQQVMVNMAWVIM